MAGSGSRGVYVLPIEDAVFGDRRGNAAVRPKSGQLWRCDRVPTRVDGPPSAVLLDKAVGDTELRARVARVVQQKLDLVSVTASVAPLSPPDSESDPAEGFVISDGSSSYEARILVSSDHSGGWLVFEDGMPLPNRDYRVTEAGSQAIVTITNRGCDADVICFAAGTWIKGADQEHRIEDLRPGDLVQTRDNGLQEILWIGQRRMSGARLHAMPQLRPIRLRPNALGLDRPSEDLLLSPKHRVLVRGEQARLLFNEEEVLVAAVDLIDDHRVFVDHSMRDVRYFHILLDRHSILWANGLETESFHPAHTTLDTIDPTQREDLLSCMPSIEADPYSYGPFVRRNLDAPEAAILRYALT